MHALRVGARVVGTFKTHAAAQRWASRNLAVPFDVTAVDMRLRLARSLVIIGRTARERAPSFNLDIGVY